MRCRSCTTELWGRPAVCPVCGTPTGLNKRSSRQTPPPWGANPAAPPREPPRPQPKSQPFFNASDLLDQEALEEVLPLAPEPTPADIFTTGPLPEDTPAPAPQQGMLNAADLFDPEILADLTGQSEEKGSQNNGAAFARNDYAPPVAEPEVEALDDEGYYRQPPRAATGPIAPPFFNLATLSATGPQPATPPPPPPFPPRARVPVSAPVPPLEEDEEEDEEDEEEGEEAGGWMPQRGYRIVSGPPPVGAPVGRAMMPAPPGMYPAGPYPMPAPPAAKRRPASPVRRRRPFYSTLGGLVGLLVVLAIIGGALLFGASRYFQLQALQPKPAQTTLATLPTVAPKAGYTIYSDQKLAFSLQYITRWQEQADHDKSDAQYQGDLFQAGGPNVGFEVGSAPQYSGLGPSQIDDYIIRQPFPIASIASIQTSVPASPTIHILNQDWTAEDADVTLTTGVNLRLTCLALIHNGRGYAIFYFAPQEVFSNDYTQFFQPMLLSFRFLNG